MAEIYGPYGDPIHAVDHSTPTRTRRPRIFNPASGMGSSSDKDLGFEFIAQNLNREDAERIYQMSWAAAKLVDIPVDDVFYKGRTWTGTDEGQAEAMTEAMELLNVNETLKEAMKAGRIFGSALLILCTDNDSDFDKPLNPEDLQEGTIRNLWVIDRWACSVENWQTKLTKEGYGRPYQYRVTTRISGTPAPQGESGADQTASQNLLVHRDRILRFDGRRSPLTEGWIGGPWQREWGVSILTRALDEIMRDAGVHASIGHIIQELSIWVQKLDGFKELIRGRPAPGEPTIEEMALEQSNLKSMYRTHYMDKEDEADRVNIPLAGLADIIDRMGYRLAAIEDIPITRFLSTSPAGMNATGESDADNYSIRVGQEQEKLDKHLKRKLDVWIARHAGLEEPPPYEWVPLSEASPLDTATGFKTTVEAFGLMYDRNALTEDEFRERASQNELVGELGPMPEDYVSQQEFDREQQMAEAMAKANGNGNQPVPANGKQNQPPNGA